MARRNIVLFKFDFIYLLTIFVKRDHKIGIFMQLNKLWATLGILALFSLSSTNSFAQSNCGGKEKYGNCVNRINSQVNSAINNLRGQLTTPAGLTAAYAVVGRQNDIFLFCKRGMNDYPQIHYWQAIDPSTGSFTITNYYYVNYQYIPYYVLLCPMGGRTPGSWQTGGTGGEVKGNTSPQIPLHIPFIH